MHTSLRSRGSMHVPHNSRVRSDRDSLDDAPVSCAEASARCWRSPLDSSELEFPEFVRYGIWKNTSSFCQSVCV